MSEVIDTATVAPPATPVAAPAAAPAASAPAPAAAPAEPAPWTASLDAATKSYVEARGFKGVHELAGKLREFEPPASADKYEIPVPEGESDEFAKAVAPLFHKAGLSAAQAKALATEWNGLQAAQRESAKQAQEASDREASALALRQEEELKREWGETFTAKTEGARRAVRSFVPGKTDDEKLEFASAMEKQFGYAGMMKFWAAIGDHMAEGPANGLGAPPPMPAKSFYDASNMNP